MKITKSVILIIIILTGSVYADGKCGSGGLCLSKFENVTFQIPDCLVLNIEDGNMVYRYKNEKHKSFIMITGMHNLSSQKIYDNLKQIDTKFVYLRRKIIDVKSFKATVISFKSLLEESSDYEAKTYVFDDLGIRFITHENEQDAAIFYDIVRSVQVDR